MDKVTVYEAKDGWRWHRKSENGEIVSESGEGYESKSHAEVMAEVLNGGEFEVVVKESD
jgi:uncharacterized protein YegP (UPF0339 family)